MEKPCVALLQTTLCSPTCPEQLQLLCAAVLREMSPSDSLSLSCNHIQNTRQLGLVASVLLAQGCEADSGRRAGAALVTFQTPDPGGVRDAQEHVLLWGLQGDQQQVRSLGQRVLKLGPVTEVDGAVATDFFTVLSTGQRFTEDQWLNVQAFSMLRAWLLDSEPGGSGAPDAAWVRALLPVAQFFLHHGEAAAVDAEAVYQHLFTRIPAEHFHSPMLAFEFVQFCRDSLPLFGRNLGFLAWNSPPLTSDFVALLPSLVDAGTAVEMLHLLLDLPCLTAALDLQLRSLQAASERPPWDVSIRAPGCLEAFRDSQAQGLFQHLLRAQASGTAERLTPLYRLLQPLAGCARVVQCAEAVPTLLRAAEALSPTQVWAIGEYLSVSWDRRCTVEQINNFFEALEALLFEVTQSRPSTTLPKCPPQVITVLMTTLTKLASRSQDLIPRYQFPMRSLAQSPATGSMPGEEDTGAVRTRATELLNLLKMPSVAQFVFTPSV
ncbi:hypothetical protein E2I00_013621, partial [Balaenoptera physalus]